MLAQQLSFEPGPQQIRTVLILAKLLVVKLKRGISGKYVILIQMHLYSAKSQQNYLKALHHCYTVRNRKPNTSKL